MRTIFMAMLVAALMATVGVYAASITGSTKTLGGTGSVTVTAPSTTAAAKFNVSGGNVATVDVTWTPAASSNYTISVDLNAGTSTGSLGITTSGTVQRTDTVTVASIAASAVTSVDLVIAED